MTRSTKILLETLVLTALAASPAMAGWRDAALRAPLAVVGRCEAQSADWEDGRIVTTSDVTILTPVQGAPPDRLRVRQRGGVVDGIAQRVSHTTLLQPGKSYLLFLNADGTPVGSGVHPVTAAVDGEELVDGAPLASILATLGVKP